MRHALNANRPPLPTMRMLNQEAFKNAAEAAGLEFKVFLAGPYIETTGQRPRQGEKNKAKRLRYFLFHKLHAIGWVVTMGEYSKLIDAAYPILGSRNDSANAELIHAKKHADAVIMLPSSPGSFMELGAFSLHEDICQKMLVIIDKKHEGDNPNYFNTGPIPGARKKGAIVNFIDYDDNDSCWVEVERFILDQGSRVSEKKALAP